MHKAFSLLITTETFQKFYGEDQKEFSSIEQAFYVDCLQQFEIIIYRTSQHPFNHHSTLKFSQLNNELFQPRT